MLVGEVGRGAHVDGDGAVLRCHVDAQGAPLVDDAVHGGFPGPDDGGRRAADEAGPGRAGGVDADVQAWVGGGVGAAGVVVNGGPDLHPHGKAVGCAGGDVEDLLVHAGIMRLKKREILLRPLPIQHPPWINSPLRRFILRLCPNRIAPPILNPPRRPVRGHLRRAILRQPGRVIPLKAGIAQQIPFLRLRCRRGAPQHHHRAQQQKHA